jgi:mannose-1-phosphate guanylyltransferase
MKILLLAGGGGTRLWPYIDPPKPFSSPFGGPSLLQMTVARFASHEVVVVTQEAYLEEARRQVGDRALVIAEAEGRNTAPALLFALKWLEDDPEELILVAPTDHLIEPMGRFFHKIQTGQERAKEGKLVLFGVRPTHAHTGYGYILSNQEGGQVIRFIEKPPQKVARALVDSQMALWNTGVLLFQKRVFFEQLQKHCEEIFCAYKEGDLLRVPPLSIDHAFLELFDALHVVSLDKVSWADVGSWEGVYEHLSQDEEENVLQGNVQTHGVERCLIFSEKKEIRAIDLEDLIIIDTDEGLLISKRGSSHQVALFAKARSNTSK